MTIDGLPQIPEAALPASVRDGSAADRRAYQTAMGFEQVLLGQLVEEMVPKGTLTEGPYAAPVQEALTGGLVAGGGIGLGSYLYPMLRREAT